MHAKVPLSQYLLGVESHRLYSRAKDAAYYRQTVGLPVTFFVNLNSGKCLLLCLGAEGFVGESLRSTNMVETAELGFVMLTSCNTPSAEWRSSSKY
jgi:hypothetical protein